MKKTLFLLLLLSMLFSTVNFSCTITKILSGPTAITAGIPTVTPVKKVTPTDTQSSDEEIKQNFPNIKPVDNVLKSKLVSWLKDGGNIAGGLVTISFDDTWESTLKCAKPILDRYRFKGVEAVIIGEVGGDKRLHINDLKEMQDDGWDVVSHSMTHINNMNTYKDAEYEVLNSQEWLIVNGFSKANSCYILPLGDNITSVTEEIASKYYYFIRGGQGSPTFLFPKDYYYPIQYSYLLVSYSDNKPTDFLTSSAIIDILKKAKSKGVWVQLTFHDIVPEPCQNSEAKLIQFQETIELLNQLNIPVVTYSDILNRFKN